VDALRRELLAVFEGEYRAHMRVLKALTARTSVDPATTADVFRRVHSLKGAARAVEYASIEALAHGLEARMQVLVRANRGLDEAALRDLECGLDAIEAEMEQPKAAPVAELDAGDAQPDIAERYVQLPQARIDSFTSSFRAVVAAVEAQGRIWSALDSLFPERTRPPAGELGRVQRAFDMIRRDRELADGALRDALAHLREDIHAAALMPVGDVFAPLAGMVRQMARDITGRDAVDVKLSGMELSIDRHTIQAMRDPAIQMLRNAIAHGAEPPAARSAAGKPETIRLALSASVEASVLMLEVIDDGRGPDVAAIRARAEVLGLVKPDVPLTEEALFAFVFRPGFSTRGQADEIAGRGMGLSIVAERVRALGGHAVMARGQSWGTIVRLALPLPRRERAVLLVQVEGQTWGLDGLAVRRLGRARSGAIRRVDGRDVWDIDALAPPSEDAVRDGGMRVPLVLLSGLVGRDTDAVMPEEGWLVVVLSAGAMTVGLIVDAIADARVFLAERADWPGLDRALAPELCWPSADVPVLLLDTRVLLARASTRRDILPGRDAGPQLTRLLVVDDAATVRALSRVVLRAEGFVVMSASDGGKALDLLRTVAIDCVITDLEMPGLDGAGLLAAMADDPALAGVPVVVMTGHDLAQEAGNDPASLGPNVRVVMAKQGTDQRRLIATVRRVLAGTQAGVGLPDAEGDRTR
jgi:two-component system, chemotaxis family, sensor kinase CheA